MSQMLTLFTTPVIYLGFDSLARKVESRRKRKRRTAACACDGRLAWPTQKPDADAPHAAMHRRRRSTFRRPLSHARSRRRCSLSVSRSQAPPRSAFSPVSPLPQVDFPTISVSASLPGASPETMAATVATPLERSLGRIAGITEMTSSSSLGSSRVTLQFELNRDIDGAARDVQAALNAARSLLPTGLPSNPTYRKVNPADAPIMILALTSDTMTQGQMYDAGSTIIAQKLSQLAGRRAGAGRRQLAAGGARRARSADAQQVRHRLRDRAHGPRRHQRQPSERHRWRTGDRHWQIYANDQAKKADEYLPLIVAYRNGCGGEAHRPRHGRGFGAGSAQRGLFQRQAVGADHHQPPAERQHHRDRRRGHCDAAAAARVDPERDQGRRDDGAHDDHPRFSARRRADARGRGLPGRPGRLHVPAQLAGDADSERCGAGVAGRDVRRHVSVRIQSRTISR